VRLEGARSLEAGNEDKYGNLKPSLEDLSQSYREGIAEKQAQLAEKMEELASTKEELATLRKSVSALNKSLMALQEQCLIKKNSFLQKKASYQEEGRVLGEAETLLGKLEEQDPAGSPSFLQQRMQVHSKDVKGKREEPVDVQSAMAEVVKEIDGMVTNLQATQKREAAARDRCKLELNNIANAIAQHTQEETHLQQEITRVSLYADTAKSSVEEASQALSDAEVALAETRAQRSEDEANFKGTVAAERKTQEGLEDVMAILNDFYGSQPNPEGHGSGKALMQMLEVLLDDSQAMVKQLAEEDAAAQKAFEEQLRTLKAEVEARESEVKTLSMRSAELDEQKAQLDTRTESSKTQGEEMTTYEKTLKASCTDLLKNFESNQEKRSEEIDQLKESRLLFEQAGKGN